MDKDYFSTQVAAYRQFRPHYPALLFDFLAASLPPAGLVIDCATGNGQAAAVWAARGHRVVGCDLSGAQLAAASPARDVYYVQTRVEQLPFADHSFSLMTVAQALHWFDFDGFYAEARRVLRPGALFAAWTYSFMSVAAQLGADIHAELRHFYHEVIGAYWPPERRYVDAQYRTIPFPLEDVAVPAVTLELDWQLADVIGYLSSWSAVALYRQQTGVDPLLELVPRLERWWPAAAPARHLSWPLDLRVGRFRDHRGNRSP